MNVLSLFDGISVGRLALDNLGIQCKYYASEVDKWAIKIAEKNFPDNIQLGDVRTINTDTLPSIELLVGGSPCTQLSNAGPDKSGLKGKDSSLLYEYIRIKEETKPVYFLLENVKSMKRSNREEITRLMGVEPILINSALVTAQVRERLYWTNIQGIQQPKDLGIKLSDILEKKFDSKYYLSSSERAYMNRKNKKGANRWIYSYHSTESKEKSSTVVSNFHKGVPNNVLIKKDGVIRKFTPIECERLQGLPDNYTAGVSNTQRYKMIGNAFTLPVIEHILSYM